LTYGYDKNKRKLSKVGVYSVASLLVVAMIYFFLSTDGTKLQVSWRWIVQVGLVWVLALTHTVIGRLIIPFDRFELLRIGLVAIFIGVALYKWRSRLGGVWSDLWSRFLLLQIGFYYLIVAVGRAQYGIGIMRAERYAYLGLALFLLLMVRALRKWKMGRWVWIVPLIMFLQIIGLYVRVNAYIERPQQLKSLVERVKKGGSESVNSGEYLPHFVLNDERLRYADLIDLIDH
jgi:hypothetical protein